MSKKEKNLIFDYDETTSRDESIHDQSSESIRRRLLNLPQQPFPISAKSRNKANSDGTNEKKPPQYQKNDDDKNSKNKDSNHHKRAERDKEYEEKTKHNKPDLNKDSRIEDANPDQAKSNITHGVRNRVKNGTERAVKDKAGKALQKGVKEGVKKTKKAALQAVAKAMKKVLMKAAIWIGKSLAALLGTIGLPALLIGTAIVILMVLLMTLSTIAIGTGKSVDYLGKDAVELRKYIVELSNKSVDPDKPEEAPYRLPEELLAAVVQLDSMLLKEDEEPDIKKMKRLLDKFYEALKPEFKSETFTEWSKTRTKSCEKYEKGEDGKNGKCVKWSGWKEKTVKRKVTRLTEIRAWNGTAKFTYKEEESDWKGDSTTQTKEMANVISGQEFQYDFSKLDEVLNDAGYNMDDKKMFEYFYESATGMPMYYIAWLNGEAVDFGGMCGADATFVGNVVPGKGVPPQFMPIYLSAQQKYGVPWYTLAAIHYVETKFSQNVSVSTAGAVGHTQFMPKTWIGWGYPGSVVPKQDLINPKLIKKYGGYGVDANGDGKADPWDVMDAIFSTANYLKASGYLSNPRKAILAYNHSEKYLNDVMSAAMKFKKEATVKSPDDSKNDKDKQANNDQKDDQNKENDKDQNNNNDENTDVISSPCMGADGSAGEMPEITKGTFMRPTLGVVTSGFGMRPGGMHYGIDISKHGIVAVVAAADGVVVKSYLSSSYGNCVIIRHNINGVQYETLYAHMRNRAVSTGQKVKKGQFLGNQGETGDAHGQHLHFEVHKPSWNYQKSNAINPLLVIPK